MTTSNGPLSRRAPDRRALTPHRRPALPWVGHVKSSAGSDEHDARAASWAISRHFECAVEALDPQRFSCRVTPVAMRAGGCVVVALASAQLKFAARPRPSALVVQHGRLTLRLANGFGALDREAGSALIPAGVAIELAVEGAGCEFVLVDFEPEAFLAASAKLSERPDAALLRDLLSGNRPILPEVAPGRDAAQAVALLVDAIAGDPATLFPELQDCLLRALCFGLFGGEARPGLRDGARPSADPRLQSLCAAALDALSSDLGLDRMAQESGLSARTVQSLFKRHLGMSPKQWVLEQRLLAVRARLCRPGECDSVTSIAIPYFSNLGEFAQRYRRRFGEKPSATLARAKFGR